MYTLGYAFKPWADPKAIADGPRSALHRRDRGRARHRPPIRFGHRVVAPTGRRPTRAGPSTRVEARRPARAAHQLRLSAVLRRLLPLRRAPPAGFRRRERLSRPIVHPQFWPDDLDLAGKRVVVIGSGATAVTLVPEMAKTAAHVTMLQRSPSYVIALPSPDPIADALKARLPARSRTGWCAQERADRDAVLQPRGAGRSG
jgi:cation diffusion facilitator CzcD-associated flavoprotein CzcO